MKKANSMAELEQLILNEMLYIQNLSKIQRTKSSLSIRRVLLVFIKELENLEKVLGTMVFLNTEKMFISIFGWIELTVM